MQYSQPRHGEKSLQQWTLKRNCALSPKSLAKWFVCIGGLSVAIALFWATQGAWVILLFAGVEVVALVLAYFFYGRHAGDFEKIVAGNGKLVVERLEGAVQSREEHAASWVRIEYEGKPRSLIWLVVAGKRIPVGRHVPDYRKREVVKELRQALVTI